MYLTGVRFPGTSVIFLLSFYKLKKLIAKLNFHVNFLGISQWDTELGPSCAVDERKSKTFL